MQWPDKVLHAIGGAIWIGAQYANYASDLVPVKYRGIVSAAVSLVAAVHGYYVGKQVRHD